MLAALPFDLAVRAVNQQELDHRAHLFEHLPTDKAVALMTAMSADQRVEVFRGLSDAARARLIARDRRRHARLAPLAAELRADHRGRHHSPPSTWRHPRPGPSSGRSTISAASALARETVYAIYVLDSVDAPAGARRLAAALVVGDPGARSWSSVAGARRSTVAPRDDREEVARLISKYDLLAVPVVDEAGRVLGIVTVDDVVDVVREEATEDMQKLGGVEALDEPYCRSASAR